MKLRYIKTIFMNDDEDSPADLTVGKVYDWHENPNNALDGHVIDDTDQEHGFCLKPTPCFDMWEHFEVVKEDGCDTEEHY